MTEHTEHSHHSGKHTHHEHSGKSAQAVTVKNIPWTNIILMASAGLLLFGVGFKYGQYKAMKGPRGGSSVFTNATQSAAGGEASSIDFSLFWEVWNKVEEKYVDEKKIDAKKMYYGAIKGMVASLEDPYTFFLTPDENKKSKDDLGGRFEGIGAQLGMKNGLIVVATPIKNSPASRAGIRSGDIITKVDGDSTRGWTLTQAVGKIRGEQGTKVKLTIVREGKELEFEITRDTIKVDSVELSYEKEGSKNIAVLKLNQFGETTNSEWDRAITEIQRQYEAGTVQGMVLDLRDNPGGYLESSVYLASDFLEQGKMIVKQESTIEEDREYSVRRPGRLLDIPLTVLINQGSASAAEILSGALRDYKRATLIGEKSFGKGSVQEALDLDTGAGLHVTVARWILPSGEWINGKGITPEIQVTNEVSEGNTLTRETDAQLQRAIDEVSK